MGYATFSQAKRWIASAAGECDSDQLTEILNDVRQRFYLMYSEVALFMDVTECFEVQEFAQDCNRCQDIYRGVTLPRDFQTVEAMWFNNSPVELRSRWREWQIGIAPERDCRLQEFDQGSVFPTERDPLAHGYAGPFKVLCMRPEDVGKTITLRGMTIFGQEASETIALGLEYQETQNHFRWLKRPGGVVKDETAGVVLLADKTNRILSRYAPDETVPAYRRIKITGLPPGCAQVNIRASRRFFPLFEDGDVIETDNKPALQEMARHLRLNAKLQKDAGDMKAAVVHYEQAKAFMLGEKSRELGKSTRAEIKIVAPRLTPGRNLWNRR